MEPGLMMFWGFLALVTVCVTLAAHLGRLESERTLRKAIESGAVLDVDTVRRLKRGLSLPLAVKLTLFGIVVTGLGIGLALFALILGLHEPESLLALLSIAGLVIPIGVGLAIAGAWLRRISKDPTD